MDKCIAKLFPRVFQHMNKLCVSVEALATSPLMSLYITSMPSMTTLRLLDIIFAHRIIPGEGSKILIGVILAIIRRNLDTLLQTDGLPEFIDTFRVR